MDNPEPNDAVYDPELDIHFSNLTMAGGAPAQGAPFHHVTTDAGASPFWPAQDTPVPSDPAATNFGDFGPTPQPHAPTFAPQSPGGLNNVEVENYNQDVAGPAYWPPGSGDAGASSDLPFPCPHEGCPNAYHRQCDLEYASPSTTSQLQDSVRDANTWPHPSKHFNNHTKRRRCDFCDGGGAETKDLNRHMWSRHPEEARELGIPKDEDKCPSCDYKGRKDNVKRHRDTKKH